jgi:hypothetical protein
MPAQQARGRHRRRRPSKPPDIDRRLRSSAARRGQALVEFALVALAVYLLLAAIVTFGYALFASQTLQQAADLAARQLARTALPANLTLEQALGYEPGATSDERRRVTRIYSEDFLVVDLDALQLQNIALLDHVARWPLLNQQLFSVMIVDHVDDASGGTRRLLRYPGALLLRSDPPDFPGTPGLTELTVGVPLVVQRSDDGVETIRWHRVVEEIDTEQDGDNQGPEADPFQWAPVDPQATQRGIVALRIVYPLQSTMLGSFGRNPDPLSGQHADPRFRKNLHLPHAADDDAVLQLNAPHGALLSGGAAGPESGTHGGRFGLGGHASLGPLLQGRAQRPYRRVLVVHALYPRELLE